MSVFYSRYKNDDVVKKVLESYEGLPRSFDCFSGYENFYNGDDFDGFIYFGFFADPKIVELAKEVNDNFKNIEIIIVDLKLDNGRCIFRVKLNDEYSFESKYILSFTMAQFMRGFGVEYEHYEGNKDVTEDFINNNLKAQDTPKYGGWLCCDPSKKYSCSREVFDKFDDVKLINQMTEGRMNFEEMPSIHRFIRVLDGSQNLSYLKRVGPIWD